MTALAAISLAIPAMLGGLTLLGLPVLAHLLNRRAKRTLVFPSVALLVASSASQSSLFKLRRWLLLLLRCLAVALLVLGFAQPLWIEGKAAPADASAGAGVVLLIDASASTGQHSGGVSALQGLHAGASRTIDAMLAGTDAANLVLASARPTAAFPKMTANLDAVRRELDALTPTHDRADFAAALALAGRMLAQQAGDKHLVVLTDMQASNWSDLDQALGSASPLPEGTRITIVPYDGQAPGNVGLSEPKVHPYAPIAGRSAHLSVKAVNCSGEAQAVRVRLVIEGRESGWVAADLGPWEEREVALDATFAHPGEHRVSFEIGDDALAADNVCRMIVRCVQRVPVVVVGDDHPGEQGTASYFLTRALAPRGDGRDPYDVRHLTGAELDGPALADAAVAFVSDVGLLPDRAMLTLHQHMQRGGSVVMFGGAGPVDRILERFDAMDALGIAPWTVAPRQNLAAHGDMLRITDGQWRSPLLEVFKADTQEAITQIRFTRVWPVDALRDDARVLLRFHDGTPAMGERGVGGGRFILAAFSPALADGDLSKYGWFVALVQNLTRVLQPRTAADRTSYCGRSVAFPAVARIDPQGPTVIVLGPDERPITDSQLSTDDRSATIVVNETPGPGFYAAVQGDRVLGQVAVNVDPRESDLRRLEAGALLMRLQASGMTARLHDAAGQDPVLNLRGLPLWGWMIAAAMLMLGVEMLLLGWWKR